MKKANTRRALLLSALSLLLCMSMLVGTTFAWFTDSVTSGRNVIQSGNLDVVLEYWDGDSYEDVETTTKLFDDAALWEPGYTEVAYLKVSNAGSLALKYQLSVNVYNETAGVNKAGESFNLSDHLVFKVVESDTDLAGTYTRETAKTAAGTALGLNAYNGETKALEETDDAAYLALIIYMPETVGNEANHNGTDVPSIELGVDLFATQYTYEEDSFDNLYDEDAEIPTVVATAADLAAALAEGGTVTLASDINLGATQIEIPAGVDAVIDLNGNDLTGSYTGTDHYAMFKIPNGASLTIEGDGEVAANTKATESNRSLALFQNSGELTLNGGTYNVNDSTEGQTWIIATIVDNRTSNSSCATKLTINGGDYSVSGKAINLFRNYPQQGGTATLIVNNGTFNDKAGETTYIWNQEAGSYLGELYFNGGAYDAAVVYEDYNGQSDVHIAAGVTIQGYSGNN